ncbi:MAG: hypothetical protein JWM19_2960 [Actinomycetia bacterium]|nr:hypothetical protein [Actinomycetes bacterium]
MAAMLSAVRVIAGDITAGGTGGGAHRVTRPSGPSVPVPAYPLPTYDGQRLLTLSRTMPSVPPPPRRSGLYRF